MIDDIQEIPYFEDNTLASSSKSENIYNYPAGYIPKFPDSVYAERISRLSEQTTIELVYNKHVKSFIDVYAVNKREHTCRILGLADVYFPLFEQTLDKYNMLGWMKHKLESRLLGEMSITSDMQMIPPFWQKVKWN